MRSSTVLLAAAALACGLAAPAAASPENDYPTLQLLDAYPEAVCNDGTPSGYYFSPAPDSAADKSRWLIFLEGGYWAADLDSCLYRLKKQPFLVSSSTWPRQRGFGGAFNRSRADNPFREYNLAYVAYCTSDGFAGTRTAPDPTANFSSSLDAWFFKGKAVMNATLRDIVARHDMGGATGPANVVLGGCSAGAQGVMVNADSAGSLLQELLGSSKLASYASFADAGWLMDSQPLLPSIQPLREQIGNGTELWQAEYNTDCISAVGPAAWRCFFSPYVVPHISSNLLVHAAQYDLFQLPYNGITDWPPSEGAQADWVAQFRQKFVSTISSIPRNSYSSACHHHCSALDDSFFDIRLKSLNVSLASAVGQWLGGTPFKGVDTCQGVCSDCGSSS